MNRGTAGPERENNNIQDSGGIRVDDGNNKMGGLLCCEKESDTNPPNGSRPTHFGRTLRPARESHSWKCFLSV